MTPAALADPAPDPGQEAMRQTMWATIERLIAEELTMKQRQAMPDVMQGVMPLQEAANHLGMSRNALYKLLHDARRRLLSISGIGAIIVHAWINHTSKVSAGSVP
jgi:RNA polymerase sigma-70 factor, ECF subfamily